MIVKKFYHRLCDNHIGATTDVFHYPEQFRARGNPVLLDTVLVWHPKHSVSLFCARLAMRENRRIMPINGGLDKLAAILKNFLQDTVKRLAVKSIAPSVLLLKRKTGPNLCRNICYTSSSCLH